MFAHFTESTYESVAIQPLQATSPKIPIDISMQM